MRTKIVVVAALALLLVGVVNLESPAYPAMDSCTSCNGRVVVLSCCAHGVRVGDSATTVLEYPDRDGERVVPSRRAL